MKRVLVCGGRHYADHERLCRVLDQLQCEEGPIDVIIHGDATGADNMARAWAIDRDVRHMSFPAQWLRYGNSAGPIRNRRMIIIGKPDLVIAFPGGSGTADMVAQAMRAAIPVREVSSEGAG